MSYLLLKAPGLELYNVLTAGVIFLNTTLASLNKTFQPLLRLWAKLMLLIFRSALGNHDESSMKSIPNTTRPFTRLSLSNLRVTEALSDFVGSTTCGLQI